MAACVVDYRRERKQIEKKEQKTGTKTLNKNERSLADTVLNLSVMENNLQIALAFFSSKMKTFR